MPVEVGEIYFTANLTTSDASGEESFSFISTVALDAGDTITFHSPESSSDAHFTYTVGAGGLAANERVTIIEESSGNSFVISHDPSGGSVGAMTGSSWSIQVSDNILAANSNGQIIAAISNDGDWDQNIAQTGLSRFEIDAWVAANPSLASPAVGNIAGGSTIDDSVMFSGTDILTQGDDGFFWSRSSFSQDHAAPNVAGTTYDTQDANLNCFAKGTLIATPMGEVAVEDLQVGDLVQTADGGTVAIRWIGRQTAAQPRFDLRVEPVRIRKHALAAGVPHTDLIVTGDHAMALDGMLINASALVNGTSIEWVHGYQLNAEFTVYHIETDAHEVILANGAAAESFVDASGRSGYDNFDEYTALYGVERIIPEMDLPRISAQRLIPDAIKSRLGITAESGAEFLSLVA